MLRRAQHDKGIRVTENTIKGEKGYIGSGFMGDGFCCLAAARVSAQWTVAIQEDKLQ